MRQRLGSLRFVATAGYLLLVFLLGGGARDDILSLIVLRPLAVVACGLAAFSLRWEHIRQHRVLFALAGATLLLIALHLVPLPPGLWTALPGRAMLLEIDRSAGLGEVWRPLSMVPLTTWNALYSCFVPLGMLLLGVQLQREERRRLLPVIIVLALVSGIIGVLQIVGAPQGPLYFYNITNNGSAVGLFANRNHQAALLACLIPMLTIYASGRGQEGGQSGIRVYVAIATGVVLVPLLLVTGSRAGLSLGALALLSVPFLYSRSGRDEASVKPTRSLVAALVACSAVVAGLVVLTIVFGRAEAVDRIMAPDPMGDTRFSVWGPVAEIGWKYFPFGSGIGSFVEIYQIDEPRQLLGPAYLNHAHNDWLEVFVTAGVAGLLLLAAAAAAWLVGSVRAWRGSARKSRQRQFARLGSILLLMLALASIGDYPLRAPSLATLAVIFALWLGDGQSEEGDGAGRKALETGTSLL